MKVLRLLVLSISIPTATAYAGQIYGTLTIDNRPVGRGVKVAIMVGSTQTTTETDDYGAYKVFVPKGKYTMKVYYGGRELLFGIFSYDDPVRYDFDVVRQGDGYYLKRR